MSWQQGCMYVTFTYSKHRFSDFFFVSFSVIFLWFSPWPTDGFNRITKQFPLTGGTIPANSARLLATGLAEQLAPVPLPGNADSNSFTISAANRLHSESWWLTNCVSATQICPDLRKKNSSFGMSAALGETLHHWKFRYKCAGPTLSAVTFPGATAHISHAVFSGKAEWKRV